MIKDDREASDLRDTELLSIANLAGSYYKAKKVRDLLSTEIRKCNEAMVHLGDRVAVVGKQVHETLEAIEELELRVAESRKQFVEAQAEMLAAEAENAKLEIYAQDLERKRETLPGLRLQLTLLDKEVQKESLKLTAVQSSYAEDCGRKEAIEQEVAGLNTKLARLEEEIAVMQSTRDMLKGQMPEHLDPEVFRDLQGNLSINLEEYISEVRLRVSTADDEISSFKMQLAERETEQESLLVLEKDLVTAVEGLGSYAAINEAKNSILAEVSTMEDALARFGRETGSRKLEIQEIESGTAALEEAFMREKQREREMSDRVKHLDGRILELEGIDNLAEEIDKLRTEAERLDINLEVDSNYLDTMTRVKEDAEAMNTSLTAAIEGHRKVVDRFERALSNREDDALS